MIHDDLNSELTYSRWRTSNPHTWTEIHFHPSICTDLDRKCSLRIPLDSRCPHESVQSRNHRRHYSDLTWSYWDSSEAVRCAVVQRCSPHSEASHRPLHTPAELPRRPHGLTRHWRMRFYSTASRGRHDTRSDLEGAPSSKCFNMKNQMISFTIFYLFQKRHGSFTCSHLGTVYNHQVICGMWKETGETWGNLHAQKLHTGSNQKPDIM